ncbi:membrane-bound alpha-1,6- mannosyltransferase Initiation-specific [Dinochytrium kinnereticum]|nr:membrane-bound alpha-1,6- mannosyltransferase Initiation-specific [Dinochytrium kinnereticum]
MPASSPSGREEGEAALPPREEEVLGRVGNQTPTVVGGEEEHQSAIRTRSAGGGGSLSRIVSSIALSAKTKGYSAVPLESLKSQPISPIHKQEFLRSSLSGLGRWRVFRLLALAAFSLLILGHLLLFGQPANSLSAVVDDDGAGLLPVAPLVKVGDGESLVKEPQQALMPTTGQPSTQPKEDTTTSKERRRRFSPFGPAPTDSNSAVITHNSYIPRTVHLTVPNKKYVSGSVQNNIESWRAMNPDFDVILHEDVDMLAMVAGEGEKTFPGALAVYKGFAKNVERADFWRYLVIYLRGGVYVDSDVNPLRPIEEWAQWFDADKAEKSEFAEYVEIHEASMAAPSATSSRRKAKTGRHSSTNETFSDVTSFSTSSFDPNVLQGFVGAEANLASEEDRITQAFAFRTQWCQWAFAFRPHHPFLHLVITSILQRVHDEASGYIHVTGDWSYNLLMRTGPGIYTMAVERWLREQTMGRRDAGVLTSGEVVEGFNVVGSVGFMPPYAFGHRAWMDPAPPDERMVLVQHQFSGSWKNGR